MKLVIDIDEKDLTLIRSVNNSNVLLLAESRAMLAVKNGKPLVAVLDKIRAEIDAESAKSFRYPNWERAKALEWALSIIDKYKRG